jgi:transketolase
MSQSSALVARDARRLAVEAAIRARTCHIGSSLSIIDILAVLYTEILTREPAEAADRFLLSKGHAASALYSTLAAIGVLSAEEMLAGYCSNGGWLTGHPERGLPGVEMTSGSLGHGPAIAVGIALAERHAGRARRRTFCLVGDGELDEGSVWEAFALAGQLGLDGLTLIIDANGLQGLGRCREVLGRYAIQPKLEAFGFAVTDVDGHDHDALVETLQRRTGGRPVKGYGIASMEGEVMSHYLTIPERDRERVLAGLEAR